MGLLSLLTLPVTGPARGGWWVMQQIVEAAEAELYDEGRITAELRALHAELDAGRLSEDDHAAAEEALLERLLEARARRATTEG
jgi:hypothetical protein